MKPTPELLARLFEDVELCYQSSNGFTDEKREQLLAGAKALSRGEAPVRCS